MSLFSTRRARVFAVVALGALVLSAVPALASADDQARLEQWRQANATYRKLDQARFAAADVVAGRLMVTTASPADLDWATALGLADEVTQAANRVQMVQVEPGEEAATAAEILARPGVQAVEPIGIARGHVVPNDPDYDQQYAHPQVSAPEAWDVATGQGAETTAVVVDSGANATHPDLGGQISTQLKSVDGEIVAGDQGDNDGFANGHSTWVSGVLGASGDNAVGIAGVNWDTELIDIDASFEYDFYTFVDMAASIAHAGEIGADVVNLSLGGFFDACPAGLQSAIDDANAAGTVVVASAANGQDEPATAGLPSVPASCDGVLSIGATQPGGAIASYSQQNEWVDLVAPGSAIYTTNNVDIADAAGDPREGLTGEEYATVDGTSFASPYVAGAVTLLRAIDPDITPTEVEGVLEATAVHPDGDDTFDEAYGWGELDLQAAAELAQAVVADDDVYPTPEPNPDFPVDGGGPGGVVRIADGDLSTTTAVDQAVAASQATFADEGAAWAVIARGDDYADALAGSTLTFGVAPVLYAESDALPEATAAELTRAVDPEGGVFLLGGSQAISDEVLAEVEELGFPVIRVGGASRGETAEAVAETVVQVAEVNELPVGGAVLAKAFDWPDAVTAGSIGVQGVYPVLLTSYGEDDVDQLHPSAGRALEALQPESLVTVGGTSAIGEEAEREAADIGGVPEADIVRLGGGSRLETAVAVADHVTELIGDPAAAFGVNARTEAGYAHVLSSSSALVAAGGGVYVPFEGEDGTRYLDEDTAFVRDWVRQAGFSAGALLGGVDVITEEAAAAFAEDLSG